MTTTKMTQAEVEGIRADTPGCMRRIHLNNAGAALVPRPVLLAVTKYLQREAKVGSYEAASEVRPEIEAAYAAVARLVGTEQGNIAFTEHATGAFMAALSSIRFEPGDSILTTRVDYLSNYVQYGEIRDSADVEVVVAPDAPEGGVDLNALEEIIRRRVPRVVAVTQVPTDSGTVQDVAAIGAMCRERDITFMVDACQSIGQMPIDGPAIGCDLLAATARKFLRGPRGVGFLYTSDRVLSPEADPPFRELPGVHWMQPNHYQPVPGTLRLNTFDFVWGLALGAGEAARYATDLGVDRIRDRARELAAALRERMSEINGVSVLDRGSELGATVSASTRGWQPSELAKALRARGINASGHARADAGAEDGEATGSVLGASPHYYNTVDEIEVFIDHLTQLMAGRA